MSKPKNEAQKEKNSSDLSNNEQLKIISDDLISSQEEKLRKLKKKLHICEKEKKEYLDGWQRSRAEFINYKKQEEERLKRVSELAVEDMLIDLLPVLDSFEIALSHKLPKDVKEGLNLIRSQFMNVLKRRGIEQISALPGEKFDPSRHESMGEVESDYPPGAIAEQLQPGYLLKERVIRPARVKLSQKK